MSVPIRFGILGTGSIVRKYTDACRLLPELELVAVAKDIFHPEQKVEIRIVHQ